jgi:hypothetical protein
VVVSHAVIRALVEWAWLTDQEAADPRMVGRAIAAVLEDVVEAEFLRRR